MFTYEGTAEGGERQDSEQSPGDAAAAGYDGRCAMAGSRAARRARSSSIRRFPVKGSVLRRDHIVIESAIDQCIFDRLQDLPDFHAEVLVSLDRHNHSHSMMRVAAGASWFLT